MRAPLLMGAFTSCVPAPIAMTDPEFYTGSSGREIKMRRLVSVPSGATCARCPKPIPPPFAPLEENAVTWLMTIEGRVCPDCVRSSDPTPEHMRRALAAREERAADTLLKGVAEIENDPVAAAIFADRLKALKASARASKARAAQLDHQD